MNKISVVSCGILNDNLESLDLFELQEQLATLKGIMMSVLKENKTSLEYEYPSFFFETSFNKRFNLNELNDNEKQWSWFFKIQFRIKRNIEIQSFKNFLMNIENKMNEYLLETKKKDSTFNFNKIVILKNTIEMTKNVIENLN